jgi:hypothetical protein
VVKMRFRRLLCVAAAGNLSACVPTIDEAPGLITEPVVLAVQFVPAEARGGETVQATVLLATPDPEQAMAPPVWFLCGKRKTVADLGPVAPECLLPDPPAVKPLGQDFAVEVPVSRDVCQVFGPDRAAPRMNEPVGRPTDPDPTGGFFQPITLSLGSQGSPSLAELRLRCGLAGAPIEVARRFQSGNPLNANPSLQTVLLGDPGLNPTPLTPLQSDPNASLALAPGAKTELFATWPACPTGDGNTCGDGLCGLAEDVGTCAPDCRAPAVCAGAEPYLWFNPETRSLEQRREALRISWSATGGAFELPRTEERRDVQNVSTNRWIAPTTPGRYLLWVVLRDDRGGVSWLSFAVTVTS